MRIQRKRWQPHLRPQHVDVAPRGSMSKFRHAGRGALERAEAGLTVMAAWLWQRGLVGFPDVGGWRAAGGRLKVRSVDVFPAVEPGIDGPGARSHHRQARAEHGQADRNAGIAGDRNSDPQLSKG